MKSPTGELVERLLAAIEEAEHLARNDLAAVLRQCEADRELIEDALVALGEVGAAGRYLPQPGDSLEEDDMAAIEGAAAVRLDVLENRARAYGITVDGAQ